MTKVVVTGAAGPLGQRVVRNLVNDAMVDEVVALDVRSATSGAAKVHNVALDLLSADLEALFDEVSAVVHLASVFGPALDGDELSAGAEVLLARRVLDVASRRSVPTVVLLSSAMVYGAWPNNPVPLTEDAPLRPNPDLRYAVEKAEIERLAGLWRDDHPAATVAMLRPVPAVAEDVEGWLPRALDSIARLPIGDDDPPSQWLHLDDLASAVEVVRTTRFDGPVNVAPDGWLDGPDRRALAAPTARVRVPERVAVKVATWRWRLGLAPNPPGILPYARHPWVVANDRLEAAGWKPTHSNEEAFLAGHEAGPLAALSPRRRQELAIGAAAVIILGLAAGGAALLLRRRRRAPA